MVFQSPLGSRVINYNYPLCSEEEDKASEEIIALAKVIPSISGAAEWSLRFKKGADEK